VAATAAASEEKVRAKAIEEMLIQEIGAVKVGGPTWPIARCCCLDSTTHPAAYADPLDGTSDM
jgi:hypothetical protein